MNNMVDEQYNTEEVRAWFENDKDLYAAATKFMESYMGKNAYRDFIRKKGLRGKMVPYNDFKWEDVNFEDMNGFMEKFTDV